MKPRTLTVATGCTSCPFFFHDDGLCETCNDTRGCTHPKFVERIGRPYRVLRTRREIDRRPKWCPLEKRDVLVTLGAGRAAR